MRFRVTRHATEDSHIPDRRGESESLDRDQGLLPRTCTTRSTCTWCTSRGGREPGPYDAGRKDTVDLRPGEAVEVIARFGAYRGLCMFSTQPSLAPASAARAWSRARTSSGV